MGRTASSIINQSINPFIFTDTGDSVTFPVPGTASVLIEISEPIVTTNNVAGDASQSLRRFIRQRRVNS